MVCRRRVSQTHMLANLPQEQKKIEMLLIGFGSVREVKNCDLGFEMQIPQYLGHSFSLYGPPSRPFNNNIYF